MLKVFDKFSKISGLKQNKSKCEIIRIRYLKRVRVALCNMQMYQFNRTNCYNSGNRLLLQ